MKKNLAALVCLALLAVLLFSVPANATGDKLRVVCTIFPEYDWVRQILGEHADDVELTLLMDNGVDLHSYQPTVDDVICVSTCDLLIYVGGESDAWIENARREAVNKEMVSISLLAALGDAAREEEVKEGMEAEAEGGEPEYDEHVWLSIQNARTLCARIAETLGALDPKNADAYAANALMYIQKLDALDAAYREAVESAKYHTLLFGDRFPFRYLTDDYGLDYYAAFVGCSAETEASFETIAFLAGKLDELGLPCVMTIEGAEHRIAETIIQNTARKDQAILTLDSAQSTTLRDAEGGVTYLSVMEDNLETLKKALN